MKPQKMSQKHQPEPPAASLSPRNPEDLRWEMQEVQLAITRQHQRGRPEQRLPASLEKLRPSCRR